MINTFHKDYPETFTALSPPPDFALSMVRLTAKQTAKQKCSRSRFIKSANETKKAT